MFNMGDKYVRGNLMLVPYRFAFEATGTGRVKLVNNITWVKTNPTPRQFRRRLVSSTEPFFHFVKSDRYYYDIEGFQGGGAGSARPSRDTRVGQSYKALIKRSGLSARQKRAAGGALREAIGDVRAGRIAGFRMKISGIHAPAFGGQGGGRKSQMDRDGFTIIRMTGRPIKRDVVVHQVESLRWNGHPAVYPEGIISEMIGLLTRRNAVVLDPYVGSGTTCVAAKRAGRNYVGIDLNPDYCRAAEERVSRA